MSIDIANESGVDVDESMLAALARHVLDDMRVHPQVVEHVAGQRGEVGFVYADPGLVGDLDAHCARLRRCGAGDEPRALVSYRS